MITRRLSLVGNVVLNRGPVAAGTDGGEIETIGPELTTQEFFLELGEPFEELSSRKALEQPHDLGTSILWVKGAEKMDVIPVGTDLLEDNVVASLDLTTNLHHGRGDRRREEGFSVLDGKDDVVVCIIDAVVTSGEAHAPIISLETEGFQTFLQGPRPRGAGKELIF